MPRVPKTVDADFLIIRSHRPVDPERILELAWAMNSSQEKDRDAGSNFLSNGAAGCDPKFGAMAVQHSSQKERLI